VVKELLLDLVLRLVLEIDMDTLPLFNIIFDHLSIFKVKMGKDLN
jgi:hypothetical protein